MNQTNNIVERLYKACQMFPDKIAIQDLNDTITFSELENGIKNRAKALSKKGIKKGDHVLLFVAMGIPLYIEVLALFHIGAVAVFLDQWADKKRLLEACKIAQCKAIIANWKILLMTSFYKIIFQIPKKLLVNNRSKTSINANCSITKVAENDPALITFTTGSTGAPKAPIRTHGLLEAQFEALLPLLDKGDKMRIDMPLLPIVLLLNLGIGRTSVIADFSPLKPLTFDPKKIHAQILRHGVTSMTASPFYLEVLSNYYAETATTSMLKKVVSGGGPIFPELAKKMLLSLANHVTLVYGSTEAEPMTHNHANTLVNNHSDVSKGLFVGLIEQDWEIKILHWHDRALTKDDISQNICKHNEAGEILICGNHVLKSYFNNGQAFNDNKVVDTFDRIWHRTGDMGYIDANGNLFLLGRCKQAISTHLHGTIYPFIAEALLQEIVGVKSGSVLKIDHKLYAVIACLPKVNETKISKVVKQVLPFIDLVVVVETIPYDKRHHTKIDYDRLADLVNQKKV